MRRSSSPLIWTRSSAPVLEMRAMRRVSPILFYPLPLLEIEVFRAFQPEILHLQRESALLFNDQDRFRSHLVAATQGARAFGSQKRVRGACETFEMARPAWLYERHVKRLADLFVK